MTNSFDSKPVSAQAVPAFPHSSERRKMFSTHKHSFRNMIYVAALLAASATSYAQSNCTDIDKTGPLPSPVTTPDSTFAVAANFNSAAQEQVLSYITASAPSITIRVCQGSSGALYNDIVSGSPSQAYTLFLSADKTRPVSIQGTTLGIGNAFQYANGIPAFYTATTTPAASYLNQGLPSSVSTAVADGLNNFVNINKGTGAGQVAKLGIGNPTLAPYGAQAQTILGLMNQWPSTIYNAGANTSPSTAGSCTDSSGTADTCEYDDIGLTKDAIDYGDVTAGFVSWGQVCSPMPTSRYVTFSAYPIQQYGILVNLGTTAAQNIAADFVKYLGLGTTAWNDWLKTNCYGPI